MRKHAIYYETELMYSIRLSPVASVFPQRSKLPSSLWLKTTPFTPHMSLLLLAIQVGSISQLLWAGLLSIYFLNNVCIYLPRISYMCIIYTLCIISYMYHKIYMYVYDITLLLLRWAAPNTSHSPFMSPCLCFISIFHSKLVFIFRGSCQEFQAKDCIPDPLSERRTRQTKRLPER